MSVTISISLFSSLDMCVIYYLFKLLHCISTFGAVFHGGVLGGGGADCEGGSDLDLS